MKNPMCVVDHAKFEKHNIHKIFMDAKTTILVSPFSMRNCLLSKISQACCTNTTRSPPHSPGLCSILREVPNTLREEVPSSWMIERCRSMNSRCSTAPGPKAVRRMCNRRQWQVRELFVRNRCSCIATVCGIGSDSRAYMRKGLCQQRSVSAFLCQQRSVSTKAALLRKGLCQQRSVSTWSGTWSNNIA